MREERGEVIKEMEEEEEDDGAPDLVVAGLQTRAFSDFFCCQGAHQASRTGESCIHVKVCEPENG